MERTWRFSYLRASSSGYQENKIARSFSILTIINVALFVSTPLLQITKLNA